MPIPCGIEAAKFSQLFRHLVNNQSLNTVVALRTSLQSTCGRRGWTLGTTSPWEQSSFPCSKLTLPPFTILFTAPDHLSVVVVGDGCQMVVSFFNVAFTLIHKQDMDSLALVKLTKTCCLNQFKKCSFGDMSSPHQQLTVSRSNTNKRVHKCIFKSVCFSRAHP